MQLRDNGGLKIKKSTIQLQTRLAVLATTCQTHRRPKSAEGVPRQTQRRSLNANMTGVARAIPGQSIYIDIS